ncbi:MAG: tetratricopeptide repeat protein [Terriglobia bacterium]
MVTRAAVFIGPVLLLAQLQQPAQLDFDGKGVEARQLIQKQIDSADSPRARANAQRDMAMSWAFEGNCARTVEYERQVMDYWASREAEEPGNAFYQEGEMANEAARVCIDSGDLNAAATWYRKGTELGLKEPGISADRRAVWEFRLQHAEARLAARRGDRAEADKHIALARGALEAMTDSRAQQEAFFPYLTGYVAFYLGDYPKALADLQRASQGDPFIQTLLGQTYDKLGKHEEALASYKKALLTRAHNPPAAYAVRIAGAQMHK